MLNTLKRTVPVLLYYTQFSSRKFASSFTPSSSCLWYWSRNNDCSCIATKAITHSRIVSDSRLLSSFITLSKDAQSSNDDDDDDDDDDVFESLTEDIKSTLKSKPTSSAAQQLHRADKVFATRSQYSRSQAFDLLLKHRVTIVVDDSNRSKVASSFLLESKNNINPNPNLKVLSGPSVKISMNAQLYLDGKLIPQLPPDLFVFHKPKGVLSAMKSPSLSLSSSSKDKKSPEIDNDTSSTNYKNRDHLGNHIPPQLKKLGMHPVGRLDYDTSGLILFSKDGQVTHKLLHPNFEVEREYIASILPDVDYSSTILPLDQIKEQVENKGIPILLRDRNDPTIKTVFVCFGQVVDMVTQEEEEEEEQEDDDNNKRVMMTHVRIIVKEGKHRMVRRMFAYCGYTVVELHRERHGVFELKDLKAGQFRPATENEILWIQQSLE